MARGHEAGTLRSSAPPPEGRHLRAGHTLGGRYRLESRLGLGADGEVWLARNLVVGSPVAVKLSRGPGEGALPRYRREARITARLAGRHTLAVLDCGATPEGGAFLVLEYVDGETLEARLQREGALQPEAAATLLGLAGHALARVHAAGIVHRDFKPANVLLGHDETGHRDVRVIDFSVACAAPWAPPREGEGEDEDAGPRRAIVGTPLYMAPEQVRGEPCTEAVDPWAFGVVAYEAVTGRLPFHGASLAALFSAIEAARPVAPSLLRAGISTAFDEWVSIALHRDPARRFRSLADCVESLRAALTAPPDSLGALVRAPSANPPRATPSSPPASFAPARSAPPQLSPAAALPRRALAYKAVGPALGAAGLVGLVLSLGAGRMGAAPLSRAAGPLPLPDERAALVALAPDRRGPSPDPTPLPGPSASARATLGAPLPSAIPTRASPSARPGPSSLRDNEASPSPAGYRVDPYTLP